MSHMLDTAERTDPYWAPLWAGTSQAAWPPPGGTGLGRRMTSARAAGTLTGARRTAVAGLLGCVDAWGTVTAEQAAATTGDPGLLDPRSAPVRALCTFGAIEVGTFPALALNPNLAAPVLYRRGPAERLQAVGELLRPRERFAATGGLPWQTTASWDRHNVLAAEVALRAAELPWVAAVLGEKYGAGALLAADREPWPMRGDALIVRHDGFRIAIELTANHSTRLEGKANRWARFMAGNPLEQTGLMVVFLTAPHPGDRRLGDGTAGMKRALLRATARWPALDRDAPRTRIGVAAWSDWFPRPREVSEAFAEFRADVPAGRTGGAGRWRSAALAGLSFDPADGYDPGLLLANTFAHVPHWLRAA
ncbi:hypothetical protein [Arthrobacter sp. KK5.5]|uniref:hypothetical protein n=1 Tax=Arthrobacter sp. KK5.5 TaxID=3373084 RepID=UPI003EE45946